MAKSTEQFAAENLVKAESFISRLCRTGSYFGVIPRKLANNRLDWDTDRKAPESANPDANERAAA
jgi:hypothetical protein